MDNNPARRMAQFELLRILAMCGVVMNHVFNYGLQIYDNFSIDVSTPWRAILWGILEIMKLLALPSVNCYILISGYFLIDKTQFRWKGIWRIWSETWFYAVGIYLLAVALSLIPFCWNDLLENATPILSNTYWFVTSYLALILIAPFLAMLMKHVSKRQYQIVLILGGIVCFQLFLGHFLMDPQQILLFVYLFLIGGYIRRYHDDKDDNRSFPVIALGGILAIMFAYTLYKNIYVGNTQFMIYAMAYNGLVLPMSVALFMWVKQWNIRRPALRSVIYAIAPLSFAVYIIHTQPVVDSWLWRTVSGMLDNCLLSLLPFVCIIITLLIFVVCISIDYLRVRLAKWIYQLPKRY